MYLQRFKTVSQMAVETAEEITRSAENWKRFLRTAGEGYRYPFKDQLLIYAQRPEARAVATMDYWNKQMKCWIKRGSKGIALIDEDLDSGKMKYVFDVADTIKLFPESCSPYLWQMQKEDEQHPESGGGDREFGTDLHVEVADPEYEQLSLFPLIADQIEGITEAAEQEKKPDAAFLVSYDMVDDILRTGGGAEDSKIRIYAKYAEETPAEDMIGILQNEYGRTGKGFTFDNQAVSVWFDETGMRIKAGMSAKGKGAWHIPMGRDRTTDPPYGEGGQLH